MGATPNIINAVANKLAMTKPTDASPSSANLTGQTEVSDSCIAELASEKGNTHKFVKIADPEPGRGYGGDQTWYDSLLNNPKMNQTGCGSIAASNVLYYYAQNYDFAKNLVPRSVPDRKEFIDFAAKIYHNYTPQTINIKGNSFGVWFLKTISNGLVGYAKEKNISLVPCAMDNLNASYQTAAEFIKKGLDKNCPVILFVLFNSYAKSLYAANITSELHYVTITRLIEKVQTVKNVSGSGNAQTADQKAVDYALTISTWGMRTEIPSLKELWNTKTASSIFDNIGASLIDLFRTNVYLAYYEYK